MSRTNSKCGSDSDRDTMRPEYDFTHAVRGKTAPRFAEGTNVVVVDADVLDVFPDAASVNEALRALAPVLRRRKKERPDVPEAKEA